MQVFIHKKSAFVPFLYIFDSILMKKFVDFTLFIGNNLDFGYINISFTIGKYMVYESYIYGLRFVNTIFMK